MKKLAIIDSHPIQYNAPVFRLLTERGKLEVKVFYTWGESVLKDKFDPGFGKSITWDIPILEGYEYTFAKNVAPNPNASSYSGIDNPEIFRDIDIFAPDYLLIFGWSFKTNLRILRHYKGKIPIIFRGDSTLLREKTGFSLKKIARRVFLSWVYSHVDKALFVGQNNKAYFLKHGLKERQLVYAPHAIDNARFAADDAARKQEAREWKRELDVPESHITVVFAGKLEPVKNVDFIIDLATAMQQDAVSFLIVGNGPEETRLKERAKGLKNVRFIDFQNQGRMPVVYRLGDVLILCSHSETWGLAINEAMACGLAVLASQTCGAAADLIRNGENGLVFQAGDIAKAKDYLKTLISDPDRLKTAAASSREIIQRYSFENIAKAIEDCCNKT